MVNVRAVGSPTMSSVDDLCSEIKYLSEDLVIVFEETFGFRSSLNLWNKNEYLESGYNYNQSITLLSYS